MAPPPMKPMAPLPLPLAKIPDAAPTPPAAPGTAGAAVNRRPRVKMQATIDFGSENNFYNGFSTNISEGGVFVATVKLVPLGTEVDLAFSLPTGEKIETKGVVRWQREVDDKHPETMPGIGIEFINLPPAAEASVKRFIANRDPMFFTE